MKLIVTRLLSMLPALCAAAPVLAGDGAQVPEGSALTLFALGIIGVIVGWRGGMRPKDRGKHRK
ncbi:MAG TPA: hypothetical protein VL094_11830 [Sphingomonadaceae bacterium]|nr:hypothetical protein [Sphingomonadaceae bacterium]